jgi:hypothetical protein
LPFYLFTLFYLLFVQFIIMPPLEFPGDIFHRYAPWQERAEKYARKYDVSDMHIVPTSSGGFFDVDLAGDLTFLANIPVRWENLPTIKGVLRNIKGKVVGKAQTLRGMREAGFPYPRVERALYRLVKVIGNAEDRFKYYEQAMFVRQNRMHKQLIVVIKRKLEKAWLETREKLRLLRDHVRSNPKMRKYFLAILVRKKMRDHGFAA